MNMKQMTKEEFDQYISEAVIQYAKEKIKVGNWTEEEAYLKSKEEYESLLPNREQTPNHYLFTLLEGEKRVGMIWFAKSTDKLGFICEISIRENYQGKGYGQEAMKQIEVFAKNIGIEKIELHVFGGNERAINLYEKLGYKMTNIRMAKLI